MTSRSTTSRATSCVGASAMTRTSASVPEARRSTRPRSPSSDSTRETSSHMARGPVEAGQVADAHVAQHLRKARHRLGGQVRQRAVAPGDELDEQERGQDPVPGHAVAAEDEVPGLFAAELEAVGLEGVADVAVADRCLDDPDPPRGEGLAQAEVAHDRDDDGTAGEQAPLEQVEGEQGEELVPVHELAGVVDREHAVGVTVEGDPERRSRGDDGLLQLLEMGRAALGVDVDPVRLGGENLVGQHRGARAQPARRCWPRRWHSRSRSRGRNGPPPRPRRRDARHSSTGPRGPTAPRRGRFGPTPWFAPEEPSRSSSCWMATSTSVASLVPPAPRSLMPLSRNGLCEADTIAAGTPRSAASQARPGVGMTPTSTTSDAFGREARGQGRLDHRPRLAGVASEQERRARHDAGRGPAEGEGKLGRQLGAGDAPDTVGAEPRRHGWLSASSTEEPYGLSSSRTSCFPSPWRRASACRPSSGCPAGRSRAR